MVRAEVDLTAASNSGYPSAFGSVQFAIDGVAFGPPQTLAAPDAIAAQNAPQPIRPPCSEATIASWCSSSHRNSGECSPSRLWAESTTSIGSILGFVMPAMVRSRDANATD